MKNKKKEKEYQLIERLLVGEEKALREFWQIYNGKIFGYIQSKVKSTADAEDILQETLLAGLEKLRDFEGKCSLSTFLCAIAKHKIVDYYRKKKVKKIVFSQLPAGMVPLISAFLGPEEKFDAKQVSERINKVFADLRPKYRQILILKYIEGRTVKEIAKLLSVTVKSAESTLFRARRAFVQAYSLAEQENF